MQTPPPEAIKVLTRMRPLAALAARCDATMQIQCLRSPWAHPQFSIIVRHKDGAPVFIRRFTEAAGEESKAFRETTDHLLDLMNANRQPLACIPA